MQRTQDRSPASEGLGWRLGETKPVRGGLARKEAAMGGVLGG